MIFIILYDCLNLTINCFKWFSEYFMNVQRLLIGREFYMVLAKSIEWQQSLEGFQQTKKSITLRSILKDHNPIQTENLHQGVIFPEVFMCPRKLEVGFLTNVFCHTERETVTVTKGQKKRGSKKRIVPTFEIHHTILL